MNKEYKLKASDFEYLGIDLHDYKPEELGILKGYIDGKSEIPTIEELIAEVYYQISIEYKEHIYNDIYVQLKNIYHELGLKNKYSDENLSECFKYILEGMIKLREEGINTLGTPYTLGEAYPHIEDEEIADYRLYNFNNEKDVIFILKERNLERLKKLFEKNDN